VPPLAYPQRKAAVTAQRDDRSSAHLEQAGHVEVDTPVGFVFQNPDHQVVMPTVAADVAFGLGRRVLLRCMMTSLAWTPMT